MNIAIRAASLAGPWWGECAIIRLLNSKSKGSIPQVESARLNLNNLLAMKYLRGYMLTTRLAWPTKADAI